MKLGEAFKQTTMEWQGLRPRHIYDAVEHADKIDIWPVLDEEPGQHAVRLYLRILNNTRPPSYLVVLTTMIAKETEATVLDAWRVPQKWVRSDPTPGQVMEKVCEECGYDIQFGNRVGRLIVAERAPLVPGQPGPPIIALGVQQSDGGAVGRHKFRITKDGAFIEVAHAYALNQAKVKEKLGPRRK